jgi:hypothetical protein
VKKVYHTTVKEEKIHYRREGSRSVCSSSRMGIQLTDDVKKVTCIMCHRVLNHKKKEFYMKNCERNASTGKRGN